MLKIRKEEVLRKGGNKSLIQTHTFLKLILDSKLERLSVKFRRYGEIYTES